MTRNLSRCFTCHCMEFTRLLSSSHLNAACLSTMYGRPGSHDTQLTRCISCHCLKLDWRGYRDGLLLNVADVYTCSKCKDLDCFESQRNAFLNVFHHLTSTLLPPILLPFLFDYLYPLRLRHKHTRIQRHRTLKKFILGSPGTENHIYNLHEQLREQMRWGHRWKGKTYYQRSWNNQDLLTVLCAYLI